MEEVQKVHAVERKQPQVIQWDDSLLTHVSRIDQQHQRLFELIEKLFTPHRARGGREAMSLAISELSEVEQALQQLIDYATFHFVVEEEYMVSHDYPEYEAHRTAHRSYQKRIRILQLEFQQGKALSLVKLGAFLVEWWTGHIMNVDMKLGAYLNSHK